MVTVPQLIALNLKSEIVRTRVSLRRSCTFGIGNSVADDCEIALPRHLASQQEFTPRLRPPACPIARASRSSAGRIYAPASAAVTARRNELDERMISFSASTRRKNTSPQKKSRGHTRSGTASVSNRRCNGGA